MSLKYASPKVMDVCVVNQNGIELPQVVCLAELGSIPPGQTLYTPFKIGNCCNILDLQ